MSRETRILLVRHPETTANVEGRYVGRGDAPFTSRGLHQASLLINRIVLFRPDALFTSPLPRARVVAEEAAAHLGLEATVDTRLTELDFGAAEGLTFQQTVDRGIPFDFASYDAPVAPGGESRREIFVRVSAAFDEIAREPGRVAIVTHGGVFRSALSHLLGLGHRAIWSFHIQNGSVAEVRLLDGHGMAEEFVTLG